MRAALYFLDQKRSRDDVLVISRIRTLLFLREYSPKNVLRYIILKIIKIWPRQPYNKRTLTVLMLYSK